MADVQRGPCYERHMRLSYILLGFVVACGGSKSSEPAPAQPPTGAPMAVQATSLKAAGDMNGEAEVKAYNFSDKKITSYTLLFRYKDASGNVLKVKPGTAFEKEHDFMSLSGNKYACEPKSWCTTKVEMLSVPKDAKTADVVAARIADAEGKELFALPEGSLEWPASVK